MSTTAPSIFYNGPSDGRMLSHYVHVGRVMLDQVRDTISQGLTYGTWSQRVFDGTLISVHVIRLVGMTDIIRIEVPIPKKEIKEVEAKKPKIGKEINDISKVLSAVPEIYTGTAWDSPQWGWLVCDTAFGPLLKGKVSDKNKAYDIKLESDEYIVKLTQATDSPMPRNPQGVVVDELWLERWDTYYDALVGEDGGSSDDYYGPWDPPGLEGYSGCILSGINPPGGGFPECPYGYWRDAPAYCCGFWVAPGEGLLCIGPNSPAQYDWSGVGGLNVVATYRQTRYTNSNWTRIFVAEDREWNDLFRFGEAGEGYAHRTELKEYWFPGEEPYSSEEVSDLHIDNDWDPVILNAAYNEVTYECAAVIEKDSVYAYHSINWDRDAHSTIIEQNDQTTRIYLWFADKEYTIWESPSFCRLDAALLNYCPDIKIYKYGEEFVVVFGVIYGIIWRNPNYDYGMCKARYGLLLKGELHLSDEYDGFMGDNPNDPAHSFHIWPDLVLGEGGATAYGNGRIHAAMYEKVKETIRGNI